MVLGAGVLAASSPRSTTEIVGVMVALIVSTGVHECAHAWTAWRLGDPTAKSLGRVTLNPIPHIDPIGTLLLPALAYMSNSPVLFGWGKPTPFNLLAFRRPLLDMALVSAAGPVSNVLLAFLFAPVLGLALRHFGADAADNAGVQMLEQFVVLNAVLAVFNLLPVPPLDGSKVVVGLLPREHQGRFLSMDALGLVVVLVLSATGVLWKILEPPLVLLLRPLLSVRDAFSG
jgi:Zn-dependent protease